MVAYEFYSHDETEICRLIGILPERRKNRARITEESIMKWVREVIGDAADLGNVRFVRVTLEQNIINDF